MQSGEKISALLRRFSVGNTNLQNEEETHSDVFAAEDLHQTKEHVPLAGWRKRIQMLKIVEIKITSSIYATCGDVPGSSF